MVYSSKIVNAESAPCRSASGFCVLKALKGCFVVSGLILFWKRTSIPCAVVCLLVDSNSRKSSE